MKLTARIAGLSYLLVFVAGGFLLYSIRGLVVADPAATAANILAHPQRYWAGYVFDMVSPLAYIVVTALFYVLFQPVNRTVSLVAALFSTVGCSLGAVACFLYSAPQTVLTIRALDRKQAEALAFVFVKFATPANEVALVFFGFYCLLIGYLVFRSGFLPRAIGVLMIIAGCGWLTFLWPPLARHLTPFNLLPGVIGEGALTLWLVIFGIRPKESSR